MKPLTRRQFSTGLAATLALPLVAGTARAQAGFPSRPVTIVVGYPAGGPTDIYCRAMADGLAAIWKQTVVVENKAGASGSIGALQVLRAPADGHTLFFTNNATNGAYEQLNPKFSGYRTLKDFAPVALFGVVPTVLVVRATLPVTNMAEFVAYAKANPGKLNFGSSAVGSAPHLAAELLQDATKTKMLIVPFSGAAPLMQALLGGTIDAYIGGPSTVMEQVKAGRLRALAALHPTRLRAAPDVPTLVEQGIKGSDYASWFGLIASAATPPALLDRINADARAVMSAQPMKDKLVQYGVEYADSDRNQFWAVVQDEIERSGRVIREQKITIE